MKPFAAIVAIFLCLAAHAQFGVVYLTVFQTSANCITVHQTGAYGRACEPTVMVEWQDGGGAYNSDNFVLPARTDYTYCFPSVAFESIVWLHAEGYGCFSNYVAIRMLSSLAFQDSVRRSITSAAASIYPNPSTGSITLHLSQRIKQDYQITVTDNTGRNRREIALRGIDKKAVVFDGLPKGFYVVLILNHTTGQLTILKAIVQ